MFETKCVENIWEMHALGPKESFDFHLIKRSTYTSNGVFSVLNRDINDVSPCYGLIKFWELFYFFFSIGICFAGNW